MMTKTATRQRWRGAPLAGQRVHPEHSRRVDPTDHRPHPRASLVLRDATGAAQARNGRGRHEHTKRERGRPAHDTTEDRWQARRKKCTNEARNMRTQDMARRARGRACKRHKCTQMYTRVRTYKRTQARTQKNSKECTHECTHRHTAQRNSTTRRTYLVHFHVATKHGSGEHVVAPRTRCDLPERTRTQTVCRASDKRTIKAKRWVRWTHVLCIRRRGSTEKYKQQQQQKQQALTEVAHAYYMLTIHRRRCNKQRRHPDAQHGRQQFV